MSGRSRRSINSSKHGGSSRVVPLPFGQAEPRSVRTSRAFALLTIAALAFLGALQVITTEAGNDGPMLQELSEKVAKFTSSGVVVSSSGVFELQQPLASQETASSAGGQTTDGFSSAPTSPQSGDGALPAVATPEATPSSQAAASNSSLCAPDPGGGPYCTYTVQEGDTLWGIAEMLDFEGNQYFSGAELLAMSNDLNDAQNWVIVPGQALRVPSGLGIVHSVDAAESVSVLAELYGITTADVINANPGLDPNNVIAGSELLIPSPTLWPVFGPLAQGEPSEDESSEDETSEEGDAEGSEGDAEEPADGEEPAGGEEATAEEATEGETEEEGPPEEAQPTGEGGPEASEDSEGEEGAETDGDGAEGETQDEGDEPEAEGTALENVSSDGPGQEDSLPAPERSTRTNPTVPEIKDQFAAGYIAGGGPPQYLEHILNRVIPCESGYNLRAFNPAGPFYGLMQFLPETWARTGGGDWADAWQQGHNTGVLLQRSSPTTQWPFCWRR